MTDIVVVDDGALVRSVIRLVLQAHPDLVVVAEADDGPAGVAAVREHRPDVALVDLRLPGLSGVDVVQTLHSDPRRRQPRSSSSRRSTTMRPSLPRSKPVPVVTC